MSELRIDFQGVVAFVPDRRLADGPTTIDVILFDMAEPRIIRDAQGTDHCVGSHYAWLEVSPADHVPDAKEPGGIGRVRNGHKGTELDVLLLREEHAWVRPDGKALPEAAVNLDASVLDHLATYDGVLKADYEPSSSGNDKVAVALRLTGGTLSVVEKTSLKYEVPRYDGKPTSTQVATALRWTVPFDKYVDLRFIDDPNEMVIRLKPAGTDLAVALRNRELNELLREPLEVLGGKDDPEFLVYGDSIVGGSPAVLKSTGGEIPGGHKACGPAAIQPVAP